MIFVYFKHFLAFGRAQLMISTEVLLGSLPQIKKMQPQIFSSDPPRELRKLSFADVISAGKHLCIKYMMEGTDSNADGPIAKIADDIRNDLYFTLLQGDLHGGKGSDKNIEARITVVDNNGIVNDVILSFFNL